MPKPTVYLDTNIISTMCCRVRRDPAAWRRDFTRSWWKLDGPSFDIYSSSITERELAAGVFHGQADCLRFVKRLKYLPMTRQITALTHEFLDQNVFPPNKPGDAWQLAVASAHRIDYLLTWNYSHLANATTQEHAERVLAGFNLRAPYLVSPESIPSKQRGQDIRRRP